MTINLLKRTCHRSKSAKSPLMERSTDEEVGIETIMADDLCVWRPPDRSDGREERWTEGFLLGSMRLEGATSLINGLEAFPQDEKGAELGRANGWRTAKE